MKILKNFRIYINRIGILKLLLLALAVRVVFLPFFFHGDLNNHAIWGIYAQDFGFRGFYDWLNFGNFAWPNYPPFSLILFYLMRIIWQQIFNFAWFINIRVAYFPSQLIPWLMGNGYLMILKLPAVAGDLGIGYLIYKYFKSKDQEMTGKISAALFLFNPAVIYLSSLWGQIESVLTFFLLLSIEYISDSKNVLGLLSFFVSLMFKVTTIVAVPVIFISLIRNKGWFKSSLVALLIILFVILITSYIFIDKNFIPWFFNLYLIRLVPGPTTLPFISVNAFNFWTLLIGSKLTPDNLIYFGLSLKMWAYLISTPVFIFILLKEWKNSKIFFTLLLFFFAAFLFLPRMHERYLYPVFAFFPFILPKFRTLSKIFILISIIFFLNLYTGWWVPKINILITALQPDWVIRSLSLLNFLSFGLILKRYSNEKA